MDDKMFTLLEKMYGEMQEGFKEVNTRVGGLEDKVGGLEDKVGGLENKVGGLENEVKETKNKVIIIEQEHGRKLDVLLDGYKQNSEKIDRIEKEVSKHEEIILRRVR